MRSEMDGEEEPPFVCRTAAGSGAGAEDPVVGAMSLELA